MSADLARCISDRTEIASFSTGLFSHGVNRLRGFLLESFSRSERLGYQKAEGMSAAETQRGESACRCVPSGPANNEVK